MAFLATNSNFAIMNTAIVKALLILLLCQCYVIESVANTSKKDSILQRMFKFPELIASTHQQDSVSYAYIKSTLNIRRRNFILMAVPTMYTMAHTGNRCYLEESYNKITCLPNNKFDIKKLLSLSSDPQRNITFPAMLRYLTPKVYGVTMISDNVLSPFNKQNRIYYTYAMEEQSDSTIILRFKPKLRNTLLVKGSAVVYISTGKIKSIKLHGEYDMIHFRLSIFMGDEGIKSILPYKCNIESSFIFFGNNISTNYHIIYQLPKMLPDSIIDNHNAATMQLIRPLPLTSYEELEYNKTLLSTDKRNAIKNRSTVFQQRMVKIKNIVWDMVGEKVLTDISQNFGSNRKGYIKSDPILNPLYMEYSKMKGLFYNFNMQSGYQFTTNSDIWLQLKGGYSFKLQQFSFYIPLVYCFDKQHDGYISSTVSAGRRIQNDIIIKEIKTINCNHNERNNLKFSEFKDSYWDCFAHYDFTQKIGIQTGFVFHNRTAVNKLGFKIIHKPSTYYTLAPKIKIQYRPWGYVGPTFIASYETSIKKLCGTNTPYTRWEFDGQYILPLHNIKSISMRIGTGFYTNREKNDYFVDFENFRQTFLPNGWNDEWSGDFELLDNHLYNQSNYYFRANFTYESPFILLAWTPFVGNFIERERLYLSDLHAKGAQPYVELGYALKTRLASVGAFISCLNGKYKDFGIKLGFELFRQW